MGIDSLSRRLQHGFSKRWRRVQDWPSLLRSRKHFAEIHCKYRGRRGFVVGNGPSLRIEDLDSLQGEICIASNRIYLAYEKTEWRPNFHVIISEILAEKIGFQAEEFASTLYTNIDLSSKFRCSSVYGWKEIGQAYRDHPSEKSVLFSDDLSAGIYGGRTVTFSALQLAAHLGLNPIYLIGCDHAYSDQSVRPKGESVIEAQTCRDHFHPEYRKPGELVNPAMIESMNISFMHAKQWGYQNGVEIINATRGGVLEIFERAELDAVISNS